MNNWGVLIILLALLILFSGCLSLDEIIYKEDISYKLEAVEKENPSLCSGIKNDYIRDRCYSEIYDRFKNRAINTKNLTLCYQIDPDYHGDGERTMCVLDVGISLNDTSICGLIKDRYSKSKCYKTIAIAKKDIKICEYCEDNVESTDFKSDCLFELFKELDLRDPSVCEKIEDKELKNRCLAISLKNDSYCKRIGYNVSSSYYQDLQDYCLYEFAATYMDKDSCLNITDRIGKPKCLMNVAIGLRDTKLCDNISDDYYQRNCYIELAKIKGYGICEKIPDKYGKDNCYIELAESEKNFNLCEKRSDQFHIEDCKYTLLDYVQISEIREIEICSNMTIPRWKDLCYKKVASKLNKAELCERIEDINNRDGCFLMIAKKEKDMYVCNGLSSLDKRFVCYLSVLLSNKDS